LQKKKGRRGLMHIEQAYMAQLTKLVEYMVGEENPLTQVVWAEMVEIKFSRLYMVMKCVYVIQIKLLCIKN
jgi:hypothetical protein